MGKVLRFPHAQECSKEGHAPTRLEPASSVDVGPAAVGINGDLFFGDVAKVEGEKIEFRRKGKRYILRKTEIDIYRLVSLLAVLTAFS